MIKLSAVLARGFPEAKNTGVTIYGYGPEVTVPTHLCMSVVCTYTLSAF